MITNEALMSAINRMQNTALAIRAPGLGDLGTQFFALAQINAETAINTILSVPTCKEGIQPSLETNGGLQHRTVAMLQEVKDGILLEISRLPAHTVKIHALEIREAQAKLTEGWREAEKGWRNALAKYYAVVEVFRLKEKMKDVSAKLEELEERTDCLSEEEKKFYKETSDEMMALASKFQSMVLKKES